MQVPKKKNQDAASAAGVTVRSLLVGSLMTLGISTIAPYSNMILRGSNFALDFSTAGAIFLFFLFVFFIQTGLKALHPRLSLRRQELVVIYIMAIVGCAIPSMGLTEYLLPITSGVLYYATPENEWAELIHPFVRPWLVPQDYDAARYFYEGLPEGMPIPWSAWLVPLLAWIPLILCVYVAMICIAVILRRPWIQDERLNFPLIQVPIAMIAEGGPTDRLSPFFKNPIMWAGFAIPFFIGSIRALHNYYDFVPDIVLVTSIPLFRNTTNLQIALSFPMVGFAFLVNLDIAFSIWFFNLVGRVQEGTLGILGVASTEKLNFATIPIFAHQGMGAMIVLVFFSLWMARRHLVRVFRKAFTGLPEVDDSDEMLSYRTAVFGLIGTSLFIGVWLALAGLAWWVVPIYLFAMFTLFVGITRVVAEGGIAATRAPLIAADFVTSGLGSAVLGGQTLTTLSFTYVWAADIRTFVLASCANGLKLAEEYLRGSKRALFAAIMLAICISLGASIWIVLYLSYTYGGVNLEPWFFISGPQVPFKFVAHELHRLDGPDLVGWISTLVGGGVMALLMIARQHLFWWPLHPLGYAVSTSTYLTNYISFSVFLAWLIKAIILKYGGPAYFRQACPFFLGLILGQFSVAGAWLVIDYFTGMTGNSIYWV